MSIKIYENGDVYLDGNRSGLRTGQRGHGTVVYFTDAFGGNYKEYKMPSIRYTFANDETTQPLNNKPALPGRIQFEKDIRELLSKIELPVISYSEAQRSTLKRD